MFFWRDRLATNKVIHNLTLNDIAYWGSFDMVQVILALHVVENIETASVADVGLSLFLYKAASTVLSIPIGSKLDSIPGLSDENIGLMISGLVTGSVYILLAFTSYRWQLFILMALFGVGRSLNLNSWRTLFNKWVDKDKTSTTFGIYETLFALGTGLMAALSGFLSAEHGFRVVLVIAGILVYAGSIIPLFIRKEVASYSAIIERKTE